MLDQAIVDQLTVVFEKLDDSLALVYQKSDHAKQGELVEMLTGVAETSARITAREADGASPVPRFWIEKNGVEVGIAFTGIPGGHEFTSLILAILNGDGKGKLPDKPMQKRIRGIGRATIRTFVSLSCENCPEVVQSLNLIAALNSDVTHEMVDGEFAQGEIDRLSIQGVPAVIASDKLLSSGAATMADLLPKLEGEFGTSAEDSADLGSCDVAVIGGGPAGATAAIYTARKGMKTVLITDRLGGQLQDTKSIENFISVPYTEGPALSANLGQHMSAYDIDLLEHRRVSDVETGDGVRIEMESGEVLQAKTLVVTTGAKWRELNVPGEKEYLGRGVAFCPHCDGPYYKGKDIAVIGGGNSGVEAAIDLAGIVASVVVVEYSDELKADAVLVDKLKSLPNASFVVNAKTTEILGDDSKVTALVYENRESGEAVTIPLAGVFVQIGLIPNSKFLSGVVEMNRYGEIEIDDKCRTSAKGIYAAGDVTTVPYKQIVVAMGEGAKAGLAAFEDLMVG